jgi:hypothetical protein
MSTNCTTAQLSVWRSDTQTWATPSDVDPSNTVALTGLNVANALTIKIRPWQSLPENGGYTWDKFDVQLNTATKNFASANMPGQYYSATDKAYIFTWAAGKVPPDCRIMFTGYVDASLSYTLNLLIGTCVDTVIGVDINGNYSPTWMAEPVGTTQNTTLANRKIGHYSATLPTYAEGVACPISVDSNGCVIQACVDVAGYVSPLQIENGGIKSSFAYVRDPAPEYSDGEWRNLSCDSQGRLHSTVGASYVENGFVKTVELPSFTGVQNFNTRLASTDLTPAGSGIFYTAIKSSAGRIYRLDVSLGQVDELTTDPDSLFLVLLNATGTWTTAPVKFISGPHKLTRDWRVSQNISVDFSAFGGVWFDTGIAMALTQNPGSTLAQADLYTPATTKSMEAFVSAQYA